MREQHQQELNAAREQHQQEINAQRRHLPPLPDRYARQIAQIRASFNRVIAERNNNTRKSSECAFATSIAASCATPRRCSSCSGKVVEEQSRVFPWAKVRRSRCLGYRRGQTMPALLTEIEVFSVLLGICFLSLS